MKVHSKKAQLAVIILLGVLGGAMSFQIANQGQDAREFDALEKNALCVVHLPEQTKGVSATFTTTRPIEMFHIGLKTKASGDTLSVLIEGDHGPIASATSTKTSSFGLGRAIQPGTYTVTLCQETLGKGGTVVIAGEDPVYVTGWQIWSRTYLGLLVTSGVFAALWRNAKNSKKRAASLAAFHSLLLGLVLIIVYLLFHEGGHALAQLAFGHFDLARSDFWGIHGHPHSGGGMGPPLEPWKHVAISCAGPMLPVVVGLALFLLWRSSTGQTIRSSRPMVNLYFSAVVAVLVFSEAVCEPAYLLGLVTAEGDLLGFTTRAGGPVWLIRGFLLSTFVISAMILWRVLPEIRNAWKSQYMAL